MQYKFHFKITHLLALAGLMTFGLGISASQAAPNIVGGFSYQETKSHSCSGKPRCQMPFTVVPAGKTVSIGYVGCNIAAQGGTSDTLTLTSAEFSNVTSSTATDTFMPLPVQVMGTRATGPSKYWSFALPTRVVLEGGPNRTFFVTLDFSKSVNTLNMKCWISGTIS
jgi:hypothetical protein